MPAPTLLAPGVMTVADVLSPDECLAYIELAESVGFGDAPITTALGPVMAKGVRNNERVMLDDPDRAADLWRRVERAVLDLLSYPDADPVGVNERLRFYRYDPGQQFHWHRDGAFRRPTGEQSRLTFMVYLNDGFEGGATGFDDHRAKLDVRPVAGTALLFHHPLMHQGAPVTSGRKYVVRTDVMYPANPMFD